MEQLTIQAKTVNVEPSIPNYLNVEIKGFEVRELISELDNSEVLSCYDSKQITSHFDHSELLDEMDVNWIKEYLRINGETEL